MASHPLGAAGGVSPRYAVWQLGRKHGRVHGWAAALAGGCVGHSRSSRLLVRGAAYGIGLGGSLCGGDVCAALRFGGRGGAQGQLVVRSFVCPLLSFDVPVKRGRHASLDDVVCSAGAAWIALSLWESWLAEAQTSVEAFSQTRLHLLLPDLQYAHVQASM